MVYHPNFGIMVYGPPSDTSSTKHPFLHNPFAMDPSAQGLTVMPPSDIIVTT